MVHCHPNARLTPRGQAAVLAVQAGMTVVAAYVPFYVSRRCNYRWLPRWQGARQAGLADRSSRPLTSPQRHSLAFGALINGLRITTGWRSRIVAVWAWRALHGAPRHPPLGPVAARAERVPVVRNEYAVPGGLILLDTK